MNSTCNLIIFLLLVSLIDSYRLPSHLSKQISYKKTVNYRIQQSLNLKLKEDIDVLPESDFDYSEELKRTGLWVASAVGFAGIIAATKGVDSAVEFCSGYVLEQCLSVDNLFVFIVLFEYFKVSKDKQDRVLSYGIWGGKDGIAIASFWITTSGINIFLSITDSCCAPRNFRCCWSGYSTAVPSSPFIVRSNIGVLIVQSVIR